MISWDIWMKWNNLFYCINGTNSTDCTDCIKWTSEKVSLTHLLSGNLKARDASTSKTLPDAGMIYGFVAFFKPLFHSGQNLRWTKGRGNGPMDQTDQNSQLYPKTSFPRVNISAAPQDRVHSETSAEVRKFNVNWYIALVCFNKPVDRIRILLPGSWPCVPFNSARGRGRIYLSTGWTQGGSGSKLNIF